MFTEIHPSVFRSSEGFEVAFLGIQYVTYREGDHVMRFFKDALMDRFRYNLREVPAWDPPFQAECVPLEKQSQIQQRIIDAAVFRRKPFETDINGPPPLEGVRIIRRKGI